MRINDKVGQRFRTWLAQAARDARIQAGAREDHISSLLAKGSIDKIKRFEKGETMPPNIEEVIAAYAKVAGIEDPRDLFRLALGLWYDHGAAPILGPASAPDVDAAPPVIPPGLPVSLDDLLRERQGPPTRKPARRAS